MQTTPEEIPPLCRRIQALAERDPRRGVVAARRAHAALRTDDPIARAWPVYTLGWALLCWERFEEARPHLHAAREAFAARGHGLTTLRCDYALLLADLFQHARPDLEQELATLAEQFELAGAPYDAARASLCLATLLVILGRARDAEATLARIEPVLSSGHAADHARWFYIQGSAAIVRGDCSRAIALLSQAEQIFSTLHSPLERAKCWFQQAWATLRQERLEPALAGYRRAEQVFARFDMPLRLALCDKGIGLLLTRMGRYDDALRSLLRALRSFTALRRASDTGTCQLNLGNIYFYAGLWDIALAYYSRAETLYSTTGVVGERIIVGRNRAMIYRIQGRSAEAYTLLVEVEAKARAIDDQAEVAEIWSEQAGLQADLGRYEESRRQYQQAGELFSQIGNQRGAADCAIERGWLALRRGEVGTAYTLFCEAAPIVARHPTSWWRAIYGQARCAEECGDAIGALDHYRSASATVAGLRRRLASEMISSGLYVQAAQLYADSLRFAASHGALEELIAFSEQQRALALQRALATHPVAAPAEYQDRIEALRRRIDALLADELDATGEQGQALDAALADYGDLLLHARHSAATASDARDVAPEASFDLAQLRAQLDRSYGADWTAVVYILVDDTLFTAVVTPEDLALARTPYDGALQRLIERASQPAYRRHTYRDVPYFRGRTAQPWEGLRALADRLLPAVVRGRLDPSHRLLVVPAGPLHALPWAALRLDEGWLVEQAIVHVVPALSIWRALAARPAAHATSALLVGCSTFGERAPPLPAVAEELASIAARWPAESLRLTDGQATQAALLGRSASDELAGYKLIHIASHAQLLPNRGLAAHVKLWDGDLWLSDVAHLRLGGALVTLSACDGAAANALPGEEVLSLSWAFLAAGASGVLASLWPAYDQAARQFMGLFYDALRQHGDAGLALAQAQRSLIRRYQSDADPLGEPLCWGSFVLTAGGHALW